MLPPAALGPLNVVVLSPLGIFLLKAQASQVRHTAALNPLYCKQEESESPRSSVWAAPGGLRFQLQPLSTMQSSRRKEGQKGERKNSDSHSPQTPVLPNLRNVTLCRLPCGFTAFPQQNLLTELD